MFQNAPSAALPQTKATTETPPPPSGSVLALALAFGANFDGVPWCDPTSLLDSDLKKAFFPDHTVSSTLNQLPVDFCSWFHGKSSFKLPFTSNRLAMLPASLEATKKVLLNTLQGGQLTVGSV